MSFTQLPRSLSGRDDENASLSKLVQVGSRLFRPGNRGSGRRGAIASNKGGGKVTAGVKGASTQGTPTSPRKAIKSSGIVQ